MEVTSIIYKTTKQFGDDRISTHISLADKCKNGHLDFHITGEYFKNGRLESWGCLHNEIHEHFPEFDLFIALHGCDILGNPTYAVVNGRYFIANGNREAAKSTLKITDDEYDTLSKYTRVDDKFFAYLLAKMGIVARWREMAAKGVELIQQLSGKTIKDVSTRYQYTPLTEEETQECIRLENEGYYIPEAIQSRIDADIAQRNSEYIVKERELTTEAIKKQQAILEVKEGLVNLGIDMKSVCYVNNRFAFNFVSALCKNIYTEESLSQFIPQFIEWNKQYGFGFTLQGENNKEVSLIDQPNN